MMKKRRRKLTPVQQVAKLRAENDRAEARLKTERANRKSLAQVWHEAFAPQRRLP